MASPPPDAFPWSAVPDEPTEAPGPAPPPVPVPQQAYTDLVVHQPLGGPGDYHAFRFVRVLGAGAYGVAVLCTDVSHTLTGGPGPTRGAGARPVVVKFMRNDADARREMSAGIAARELLTCRRVTPFLNYTYAAIPVQYTDTLLPQAWRMPREGLPGQPTLRSYVERYADATAPDRTVALLLSEPLQGDLEKLAQARSILPPPLPTLVATGADARDPFQGRFARGVPMRPAHVVALAGGMLHALAAMHAAGLVHGDVTARNVGWRVFNGRNPVDWDQLRLCAVPERVGKGALPPPSVLDLRYMQADDTGLPLCVTAVLMDFGLTALTDTPDSPIVTSDTVRTAAAWRAPNHMFFTVTLAPGAADAAPALSPDEADYAAGGALDGIGEAFVVHPYSQADDVWGAGVVIAQLMSAAVADTGIPLVDAARGLPFTWVINSTGAVYRVTDCVQAMLGAYEPTGRGPLHRRMGEMGGEALAIYAVNVVLALGRDHMVRTSAGTPHDVRLSPLFQTVVRELDAASQAERMALPREGWIWAQPDWLLEGGYTEEGSRDLLARALAVSPDLRARADELLAASTFFDRARASARSRARRGPRAGDGEDGAWGTPRAVADAAGYLAVVRGMMREALGDAVTEPITLYAVGEQLFRQMVERGVTTAGLERYITCIPPAGMRAPAAPL